jgi:hypothetical protein
LTLFAPVQYQFRIKNASGHIETGPMPDLPSQPELGPAQPRL